MAHNFGYFSMVIYKITNKVTGKIYIGQTIQTLHDRWREHVTTIKCRLLAEAIRENGRNAFVIESIARCDSKDEMNSREEYYIKLFKSRHPFGYNLNAGGYSNKKHEDTKKINRDSQLGKSNLNEFQKKKISTSLTKFYADRKNRKMSSMVQKTRVRILCHQNGMKYDSIRQLARELNLHRGHIGDVLKGAYSHHKGYTFERIKESQ